MSNLVTPFWHVSISDRMANYEPWGSDYYVIRPDLFIKEAEMYGESVVESSGNRSFGVGIMASLMILTLSFVA